MELSIIDYITVGMPEAILSLMIGIYIFGDREKLSKPSLTDAIALIVLLGGVGFTYNKSNWIPLAMTSTGLILYMTSFMYRSLDRFQIIRIITIAALVLITVNIARSQTTNILLSIQASIFSIAYFACKGFKWTFRKAYLAASFAVYVILASETVGLDLSLRILNLINSDQLLTSSKFLVTIPTRIIQLVVIHTVFKHKVNYSSIHIINVKRKNLEPQEKTTLVSIIISITLANLMAANYVDLIVNMNNMGILRSVFETNLNIMLVVTFFFVWITAFSLNRVMRLEHAEAENASYIELLERRRT